MIKNLRFPPDEYEISYFYQIDYLLGMGWLQRGKIRALWSVDLHNRSDVKRARLNLPTGTLEIDSQVVFGLRHLN